MQTTTRRVRRAGWPNAIPAALVAAAVAWATLAGDGRPVPAVAADPVNPLPTTTPDGADGGRGGHGRPVPGRGQPVTDRERADAMDFLSKHAPVRYRAMQAIPRPQEKVRVEEAAVRLVVALRRGEPEDSDLFRATVKRIEADDAVFGLTGVLRHPTTNAAADGDRKRQLRDAVAVQVDARLAEQRARLDRLAQTLRREQQRLDQDARQRDKLIDDQYNRYLADDGQRPFAGGGRPGGRPARAGDGRPPQ